MRALFEGRSFAAFLFDLDGTLLTSIEAAERVWTAWAIQHDVDVPSFLSTIHGRRAEDTVRAARPDLDVEKEAQAVTEAEIADVAGVRAIPGAAAFLAALPQDRWAIVTSAPHVLASRRLEAAGLPVPDIFITAEQVKNGKPSPEGFVRAAKALGVDVTDCLIFEDAPAGLEAAKRAGAEAFVIRSTHTHPIAPSLAGASDYLPLRVTVGGDGLALWTSGGN